MAPAPPFRRGSNRPRADSQQETGNPGRRNSHRQGMGRHCGRSTGVALDLMHTSNAKKTHAGPLPTKTNNRNTDRPKPHPQRNQTAPGPEPSKHPNGKTSDGDERKKKTGAGRNLDEGEGHGVRVEVGVLVQDEETQGEPQTPRRGFGFPSA